MEKEIKIGERKIYQFELRDNKLKKCNKGLSDSRVPIGDRVENLFQNSTKMKR